MLRLLALAAVILTAAAPPPPAILAPYIKNSHFDPGDYGWMRGRFADATARQKADALTIDDWLHRCAADERARTEAELVAAGVNPPASFDIDGDRDPICAAVAFTPHPPPDISYAQFAQALPRARSIADAYLFAVALAEAQEGADLRAQLILRPTGDQMLRGAFFWGQGEASAAPAIDPVERLIVLTRIGAATTATDHANTAWLKNIVAKEGWPSVSKVGEAASRNAWLLVQHADDDPAFQYRVLKLMAPLQAVHDLPSGNYAYLYDRVMLRLTGKQRYATQMTCAGGRRMPQPLEDAATVAQARQRAGLKPLADYLVDMERLAGPCPPDVIPPSPAKR